MKGKYLKEKLRIFVKKTRTGNVLKCFFLISMGIRVFMDLYLQKAYTYQL